MACSKILRDSCLHLGLRIARNREAIDKLREYRTTLISAAVAGKIDAREEA